MLEKVADQLAKLALADKSGISDHLARSAFNRYYYSIYLAVREASGSCDRNWRSMPHNNYVDLLNVTIRNNLKKGRDRARRLKDSDTMRICSIALDAQKRLAENYGASLKTRILADYEPETKVHFDRFGDFFLNNVSYSSMRQWSYDVHSQLTAITEAWRQINA
jgi:hypothetical protein